MKKYLVVTAAAIVLTAATVFAQTSGGSMGGMQHEGMGGKQGMNQGQMMSQDMMKDMSSMMEQMNGMMQKLSHPMRHVTVTDHAKMNEMGKIMRDMAAQMNEMATHMEMGKMDQDTVNKMHENMRSLNKKLDAMQKEGK